MAAKAFTLIELLTVIAIIGILAGIIIPVVGGVQTKAKKSKVKGQFNQWALAMEAFKTQYGYYPSVDTAGSNNTSDFKINPERFSAALTGRKLDGTVPTTAAEKYGNTKGIRFYDFAQDELVGSPPSAIKDIFDNTEIAVLTDKNGDGIINNADVPSPPSVVSAGGGTFAPTLVELGLSPTGIRGGVLFYDAGPGLNGQGTIPLDDAILSWNLPK